MENCSFIPVPECPGRYCGRTLIVSDENFSAETCYSECTACPTGSRVDSNSSLCVPCDEPALLRDYFFLGFLCLVCVAVRLAVIVSANIGQPGWVAKVGLVGMTLLENSLAMLFTLLVLEPQGSLGFSSCQVREVADFYPIFFNPTQDYVHQLRCSYEVVFPLYRMLFIFFGFYLLIHVLMFSVSIPYMWLFRTSLRPSTEFAWLVVFPVLIIVFAIFAGIFYYIFDYLTIVVSVGGFAVVSTFNQASKYTFKNPFKLFADVQLWIFTVVCMLYLAYGVLSLTEAGSIEFRSKLLPTILALPLLHPLLTYFASPQAYFSSWGVQSYRHFYDH